MTKTLLLTSLFLFLLIAPPAIAETLTFTIVGIDCEGCVGPITRTLKGVKDVAGVRLDWKKATASVNVPTGFDRALVRKALVDLGFEVIFPGEKRKDLERPPADVVKTLDVKTDAGTRKVDVAKTVVPGKVTILDFYADWCGPCHVLEARLLTLMTVKPNLALRRVNVGKWDNQAAKQATHEFRAESLPYIRVYDAKGRFVAAVTGGAWDKVLAALEKAEKKS